MDKGYQFTGIYEWNHELVKKRAAQLRKEGHKAVTIYSPGSKYSRSGRGGGWSVYWIESEASKELKAFNYRVMEIKMLGIEREKAVERIAIIDAKLKELQFPDADQFAKEAGLTEGQIMHVEEEDYKRRTCPDAAQHESGWTCDTCGGTAI